MPEIWSIYDSNPIQPIARPKEKLAIFSRNAWGYYQVEHYFPIQASPASTVEMVTATGNTTLAAGGTIRAAVVAILALNDFEFVQFRFKPLDNIEVLVWEQSGQQLFSTSRIHSRVDPNSELYDVNHALNTVFILGQQRDAAFEVRNPMGRATPLARIVYWGFRYKLVEISTKAFAADKRNALELGQLATVRELIGPVTFVPAEGSR